MTGLAATPDHARGSMTPATVERRTLRGALEAVLITGIAAPAGFAIVVILGRLSPEILGFYALVTLLFSLFAGLFTFGGPAVATVAAADEGSQFNRATVMQAFVAPPLASVVAAGLAFVPGVRPHVTPLALAALGAAAAAWMAAQGATTARMRFGITSLLQSVPTLVQFVLFGLLAVGAPEVLRLNAHELVTWSTVAIPGVIGIGYLAYLVARRRLFAPGPPRLARLVVGIEAIVVLTFVFESGERIAAVAGPNSLATLGRYFAGLQVAYIVRRLPMLVGQAALPGFAALRGTERSVRMRSRSATSLGLISFAIASALVLLSPLIGTLFGDRYRGTAGVVTVVAIACAVTASWPVDTSYATAEAKLRLYQTSLALGTVCFLPLVFSQGLLVLALCRAGALLVAFAVVVSGLRDWTRERVTHIVAVGSLSTPEIVIAHFHPVLAILVATWICGVVVYGLLLSGPRRRRQSTVSTSPA